MDDPPMSWLELESNDFKQSFEYHTVQKLSDYSFYLFCGARAYIALLKVLIELVFLVLRVGVTS